MKIEYDLAGHWTTIRDGQVISPGSLSPAPQDYDWSTLANAYRQHGAVFWSSEWVGWVPVAECGTSGDINSSGFAVKNIRVNGSVVQGPTPRKCSEMVAEL